MEGAGASLRSAPALLQTPPYVTARPVVTHRKLSLPSSSSPSSSLSSKPKSSLRFIILATDGLWDELSSEDAVSLVGGYLAGLSGNVPKSDLAHLVPVSSDHSTVQGKGQSKSASKSKSKSSSNNGAEEGEWTFVDSNVSSHLIRNAFGGGDEERTRQLLSISSGLARNYRDDVTCTVVWWDAEDGTGSGRTERVVLEKERAKAKL